MSKKVDAILSPSFVEEMMRLAFANREFARLVTSNLDLSNFPRELGGCKSMLKVLNDNMKNGRHATFGMVEMARLIAVIGSVKTEFVVLYRKMVRK